MAPLKDIDILPHIKDAEKLFLPKGKTFDQETLSFITDMDSTDVVACPGSGKTTALLAKLFILSKYMPFDGNKGICVLTHTNVAIDEIKRRMGKASSALFTYPNFFGTIQSFVDRFLSIPAYVGLYDNRDVTINDDVYESRFRKLVFEAANNQKEFWKNPYIINLLRQDEKKLKGVTRIKSMIQVLLGFHPIWDWGESLNIKFCNYKKNVSLNDSSKENYKNINELIDGTLATGALRYRDAFNLGKYYVSRYPQVVEAICSRFKYLFMDEMQDTDHTQIDLINRVFNDSVVKQRIGDPNQAIYDSQVTEEDAWVPSENKIIISNSKRMSQQIANVIHNVCIKPEANLEGVDRGTDNLLSPVMILYDNNSQLNVLTKYCELIKEREILWKDELAITGKTPEYYAVGWTHDNDEVTSKGLNKTSIQSYYPDYHRPVRSGNPIYDSLKNYLVKPTGSHTQLSPTDIYNSLISLFLRVLSEADKNNPTNSRRYTKKSLLEYLKVNEMFYTDFKVNMANWVKQICKHACDNETCTHRSDVYPTCVFDQISQYLKQSWLPHFEIDEHKVDMFIDNPIEHIEVTSSERNVFSSQGVEVKLGTVHSVKGQTHTATLFLECFRNDFNGKQLLDYMTGDKTYNDKDGKNKKCALKIAYVAMSRPTHFLCAAFHKGRVPCTTHKSLRDLGWSLVTI